MQFILLTVEANFFIVNRNYCCCVYLFIIVFLFLFRFSFLWHGGVLCT